MTGFDMHIHSNASDGRLSATQIIDLARANEQLTGIAITDHDTVAGLPLAIEYARQYNYPLIPGIELSAEYENHDVHILGYWIDVPTMAEDERLNRMSRAREERCRKIIRRLEALGMPLDADKVISAAGTSRSLGRPHVAQAMIEAGYVASIKEAFAKWLSRGLPAYVPRLKLSPREALQMVKDAGGAAVLAHPGVGVPDFLVPRLVRMGLCGIEVYHSEHNMMAEKKYLQMARHYRLAAMGGSDFHTLGLRDIGSRVTALGQLRFLAEQKERLQAKGEASKNGGYGAKPGP